MEKSSILLADLDTTTINSVGVKKVPCELIINTAGVPFTSITVRWGDGTEKMYKPNEVIKHIYTQEANMVGYIIIQRNDNTDLYRFSIGIRKDDLQKAVLTDNQLKNRTFEHIYFINQESANYICHGKKDLTWQTYPALDVNLTVNTNINAQWSLVSDLSVLNNNGSTIILPVGNYTIYFPDIIGFTTPLPITINLNENTVINVDYIALPDPELTVYTEPAAAGGLWDIDLTPTRVSGDTITLSPDTYTITFSDVSGYITPADITVGLIAGTNQSLTGIYAVVSDDYYIVATQYEIQDIVTEPTAVSTNAADQVFMGNGALGVMPGYYAPDGNNSETLFSPAGNYLAVVEGETWLNILDLSTNDVLYTMLLDVPYANLGVEKLTFTADGAYIAFKCSGIPAEDAPTDGILNRFSPSVNVFETNTGQRVLCIGDWDSGDPNGSNFIPFNPLFNWSASWDFDFDISPDGAKLVVVGSVYSYPTEQNFFRVYDVVNKTLLLSESNVGYDTAEQSGYRTEANWNGVKFSPDSTKIFVACTEITKNNTTPPYDDIIISSTTPRVFDANSGAELYSLSFNGPDATSNIPGIADWSPNGNYITAAYGIGSDTYLIVWDVSDPAHPIVFQQIFDGILDVLFSPHDDYLFVFNNGSNTTLSKISTTTWTIVSQKEISNSSISGPSNLSITPLSLTNTLSSMNGNLWP